MSGYGRLGITSLDDSSDDYGDSDNEYDYRPSFGRRKKKEDDIYGVFGSDGASSDEEVEGHARKPSFRRQTKAEKAANYSLPIMFVSGGKQDANDREKKESEKEKTSRRKKRFVPAYSTNFSDDDDFSSDSDSGASDVDKNTKILNKFGYSIGEEGRGGEQGILSSPMDEDFEERHVGLGSKSYSDDEASPVRAGLGSFPADSSITKTSVAFHSRFASAMSKSMESPILFAPASVSPPSASSPMDMDMDNTSVPETSPPLSNEGFRSMFLSASSSERKGTVGADNSTPTPVSDPNATRSTTGTTSFFSKSQKTVLESTEPAVAPSELGLGKFEKHTKGFGAKYLEKFNFTGRLGKHKQGIMAPIAVKVRPTQLGLGYGGFTEASRLKQNTQVEQEYTGKTKKDDDQDGVSKKDAKRPESAASVAKKRAPKVKTVYKTAAELLLDEQRRSGDAVPSRTPGTTGGFGGAATIIDMRGPQTRVIQAGEGVGAMGEAEAPLYVPFTDSVGEGTGADVEPSELLPLEELTIGCNQQVLQPEEVKQALEVHKELLHNIQLLVEMAEGEIRGLAREQRNVEAELALQSRYEAAERTRLDQERRHNEVLDQLQREINHLAEEVQGLVNTSETTRKEIQAVLKLSVVPDHVPSTHNTSVPISTPATNGNTSDPEDVPSTAGDAPVQGSLSQRTHPVPSLVEDVRGGIGSSRRFGATGVPLSLHHASANDSDSGDDGFDGPSLQSPLHRMVLGRPTASGRGGATGRRGAASRRPAPKRTSSKWDDMSSDSEEEGHTPQTSVLLRAAHTRGVTSTGADTGADAGTARVLYQRSRTVMSTSDEVKTESKTERTEEETMTEGKGGEQRTEDTALTVSEYKNTLQAKLEERKVAYDTLVCKLADLPGVFETILSIPQAIQMGAFALFPSLASTLLLEIAEQWAWQLELSSVPSVKHSKAHDALSPQSLVQETLRSILPPVTLKDIEPDWKLIVTAMRQARTLLAYDFVLSLLETDADFQRSLVHQGRDQQGLGSDSEDGNSDLGAPFGSTLEAEKRSHALQSIQRECDSVLMEYDEVLSGIWKGWCVEYIERLWNPILEPNLSVLLSTLAPSHAFASSSTDTASKTDKKEDISTQKVSEDQQTWPIGPEKNITLPTVPLYPTNQDFLPLEEYLDLLRKVRARLDASLQGGFIDPPALSAFSMVPTTKDAESEQWIPLHYWTGVWHAKHLLGYRTQDSQAKRQPPLLYPFWAQLKRAIVAKLEHWDPFDPRPLPFLQHWRSLLPQREYMDLLHSSVLPPLNGFLGHILKLRPQDDAMAANEYYRQIRKATDVLLLYFPVLPPVYTCLVFETHILPAILRVLVLSLGFGHVLSSQPLLQSPWARMWRLHPGYFTQVFETVEVFPSTSTGLLDTMSLPCTPEWKQAQSADILDLFQYPSVYSSCQQFVLDVLFYMARLPSPDAVFSFANHWRVSLFQSLEEAAQVRTGHAKDPDTGAGTGAAFSLFAQPVLGEREAEQIRKRLELCFSDVFRVCNLALDAQAYLFDSFQEYLHFCQSGESHASFPTSFPSSLKSYTRMESKMDQYSISVKSALHSLGVLQDLSFEERMDREKQRTSSTPSISTPSISALDGTKTHTSGPAGPHLKRAKTLTSQTLASPVLQELLSSIQHTRKPSPVAEDTSGTTFISFFASLAEEAGLLFAPDPVRQAIEGSVVYRIGKFPCYFYKGVVFVDFGNGYRPMDVDTILLEAQRRN